MKALEGCTWHPSMSMKLKMRIWKAVLLICSRKQEQMNRLKLAHSTFNYDVCLGDSCRMILKRQKNKWGEMRILVGGLPDPLVQEVDGNGEDVEGKGVGCKWKVDRILGVVGVVSNIYKLDASDVANIHVKSTWSSGVHPRLSL